MSDRIDRDDAVRIAIQALQGAMTSDADLLYDLALVVIDALDQADAFEESWTPGRIAVLLPPNSGVTLGLIQLPVDGGTRLFDLCDITELRTIEDGRTRMLLELAEGVER